MSDALEACPFCGCEGDDLDVIETSGTAYVHCNNCESDGPLCDKTNRALAVSEWNTRAAPEQPSTADMVAPKGHEPAKDGEPVPLMVHCSHCGGYEPVGQSQIDRLANTAEAQARALEDAGESMCEHFRERRLDMTFALAVKEGLYQRAKRIREKG